jgi:hypothetical protein
MELIIISKSSKVTLISSIHLSLSLFFNALLTLEEKFKKELKSYK